MAGIKAHARDATVLEDIRIMRSRGWPAERIATTLGISRATLYRILAEARR